MGKFARTDTHLSTRARTDLETFKEQVSPHTHLCTRAHTQIPNTYPPTHLYRNPQVNASKREIERIGRKSAAITHKVMRARERFVHYEEKARCVPDTVCGVRLLRTMCAVIECTHTLFILDSTPFSTNSLCPISLSLLEIGDTCCHGRDVRNQLCADFGFGPGETRGERF